MATKFFNQIFPLLLALSLEPAWCGVVNTNKAPPELSMDMIIHEDMRAEMATKSGQLSDRWRWPNAIVPIYYDDPFTPSEMEIMADGLNFIASRTCVRFTVLSSPVGDFVNITKKANPGQCNSYVGRIGGSQPLKLGERCVHAGVVAHEMIHALGFFHEQSRSDRDDYVTVMYDNVQDGMEHNFVKYADTQVTSFGIPYDYNSIMHYGAYFFAKDTNKPTLVSKDPNRSVPPNGSYKMSDLDGPKINKMYCEATPTTTSTSTSISTMTTTPSTTSTSTSTTSSSAETTVSSSTTTTESPTISTTLFPTPVAVTTTTTTTTTTTAAPICTGIVTSRLGLRIRQTPNIFAPVTGNENALARISMSGRTTGTPILGNSYWFRVPKGYVPAAYIKIEKSGVVWCNTS